MNVFPTWITLESRTVHGTRWMDVRQDRVIQPDGVHGHYDHVVLPASVTILAVDADGRVPVTSQWIYTHGGTQWRLPAGGKDPADREPLDAAKRELAEEVGAQASDWVSLVRIHGADSATNHVDHLFLARDLTLGESAPESTEADLRIEWMPFERVLDLVLSGLMPHAGSVAAVLAGARLLEVAR